MTDTPRSNRDDANPARAAVDAAIYESSNDGGLDASWKRVDLSPYLSGDMQPTLPTVLRRDDGPALFYAGSVNSVHGDSGSGKSLLATFAAAQELKAGRAVQWLNLEDATPLTLIERLRLFGVADGLIADRLHYFAPHEPFTRAAVEHLCVDIADSACSLVVLDSLGEAFALEGRDENLDAEVGPFLRYVVRPLADAGPAVVLVDHSTKSQDSPLHASGSKRKRAAITGTSLLLDVIVPFTRERGGRARLIVAKDRNGNYRRGDVVALFELDAWPDGGLTAHVLPPPAVEDPDAGRLWLVARRAVAAAKRHGQPASQNVLLALMRVKASTQLKRAGVEFAVSRGALTVQDGPRNTRLHTYVRDLRDEDSPSTAPEGP